MIVADLPFGTYQRGRKQALDSASRLVKDRRAGVKLEGGRGSRRRSRG